MNKNNNNLLITFLFFVLLAQACYAEESAYFDKVKIEGIRFRKIIDGEPRIMILNKDGHDKYLFSFFTKTDFNYPYPKINFQGSEGEYIASGNDKVNYNYQWDKEGRIMWKVLTDSSNVSPAKYNIEFCKDELTCGKESFNGTMPELKVKFVQLSQNESDKFITLQLENISSNTINLHSNPKPDMRSYHFIIQDKENKNVVSDENEMTITIGPRGSVDVDLQLEKSACRNVLDKAKQKQIATKTLIFTYDINGVPTKGSFEIEIDMSCNWFMEKSNKFEEVLNKDCYKDCESRP